MDDTANANWGASGGLSFQGVGGGDAEFIALAVGQQVISADDYISVVPDCDFVCIRFCEQGDLGNSAYVDVVRVHPGDPPDGSGNGWAPGPAWA